MKSPKIVRSRMRQVNKPSKSPGVNAKKASEEGKENMGLSHKNNKVTKVRPVPDFKKMHKKWETQLNMNKAQLKKPLTMVHEFDFSKPAAKKEHVVLKELNSNKVQSSHSESKTRGISSLTLKEKSHGSHSKSKRKVEKVDTQEVLANNDSKHIVNDTGSVAPDCNGGSFDTVAPMQRSCEIPFEEDEAALDSIISNTGITDESMNSLVESKHAFQSGQSRQTVDGSGFKAPLCPNVRNIQQATRKSIYYTGSTEESLSKKFLYSEFARQMASRLTLDVTASKIKPLENVLQSPAPKVTNKKNSVYVEVDYRHQCYNDTPVKLSPSKEVRLPASEKKPQRILKTPQKSVASRLSKSSVKKTPITQWRDLLRPKFPDVKVELFKEDENEDDDDLAKQVIEPERNQDLQKGFSVTETKKKSTNVMVIGPDSPAFNRPAPSTPSKSRTNHQLSLEQRELNNPVVPTTSVPKRKVLGELNNEEIAKRSSPSYRDGRSKTKQKSVLPSCVLGSEQKITSKKVHFEDPSSKDTKSHLSPSVRYSQRHLSSNSNEEVESLRKRMSNMRRASRYSPLLPGHSLKARDYSPTSRLRDSQARQVYSLIAEVDKENFSPNVKDKSPSKSKTVGNVVVTPSKRTTITEKETEFVVEVKGDSDADQLNDSMCKTQAAIEDLVKKEQSLLEQSMTFEQSNLDETTGNATLVEQMELIKKKQRELMALQEALQEKLERRRKGKKHTKENKRSTFDIKDGGKYKEKPLQYVVGEDQIDKKQPEAENNSVKKEKRNVVDVSPIVFGPISGDLNTGFGHNVFLTPDSEKGIFTNVDNYNNSDSPMIFSRKKSNSNELGNGGLSQGLLQMAQNLNATPHNYKHWKKQYLSAEQPVSLNISKGKDNFEDSFQRDGTQISTLNDQTPPRSNSAKATQILPIGTPRSTKCMESLAAMSLLTPPRLTTNSLLYDGKPYSPLSSKTTPLGEYPASPPRPLFSGSAQLLINSPLQTPLMLKDALCAELDHSLHSIDGSPENIEDGSQSLTDLCIKSQQSLTPLRKPAYNIDNTGSLSLAANLQQVRLSKTHSKHGTPFSSPPPVSLITHQPRRLQTPACNELQQTLFSKVRVKYMDAVADDEVERYNTRLKKQSGGEMSLNLRIRNPLSKNLTDGDDYHFLPIIEPVSSPPRIVPSLGSAFSMSSAFRQIRV